MLIDIVVLPPKSIRNRIGLRLNKEIAKFPYVYIVDNKKLIPHLSLWHLKISKSKIGILEQELRKAIKQQNSLKIASTGLDVDKGYKTCISFSVRKTQVLEVLQQKVFQATYRLNTGIMPHFSPLKERWKGQALKEAKKYSRPLGFNPHFTSAWLKEENTAKEVVRKMKKFNFAFSAKEIYLCEVNGWWQVIKIIKEIEFN